MNYMFSDGIKVRYRIVAAGDQASLRGMRERVQALPWILPILVLLTTSSSVVGAPVKVRFAESTTHGFLVLRNERGDVLAHGELVQAPRGPRVENRMTFRFKDGSFWEETLSFTQSKVFRLMAYHQVQKGLAFPEATDVSFDRDTGRYRAKIGDDDAAEGNVELPDDLFNGMASTLMKNLPAGTTATGHNIVFTPKPQILDTELRPEGEDRYFVGDAERTATRYLLKMEPRGVAKVVAPIIGKEPPEVRFWISNGTAPTFVKSEGPVFLKGPSWLVELGTPRWPEKD
jgi:hypothetical protein